MHIGKIESQQKKTEIFRLFLYYVIVVRFNKSYADKQNAFVSKTPLFISLFSVLYNFKLRDKSTT